ncbi:MAG TPA: TonB-dependent receptor, partial [Xanthomonadaceae bacterium]|nr:TonB-dependent receptor [Xanthomonadaceae bacterium]
DPNTIASLQNIIANPFKTFSFIQREVELNASGDLFDLPAGAIKPAVGGDSRREYQNNRVDSVSITNGPGATCDVAQEACSSPLVGAFNVKEVYAELFIPILKDAPGAYALNLDLGNRYSKYNIFSGNDSSKVAIEWRPIKDLLVRGSASDIFRAPSAGNLFGGSAGGAPGFNGDPCVGANAALLAAHPRACGTITGIPSTTVSGQTTGLFEGSILGGQNLGPEKGRSYDFGVVYDPQFVQGLSTSFDFYRITLNNLITQLSPNVVMNDCFHDEASPFCSLIHRQASDGGIAFFQLPVANIGTLTTDGFDFSIKYRIPVTPWGQFSVGADFTHINKYDVKTDPNPLAMVETRHLAGQFDPAFGNFIKWRGNFSLDWSKGDWNAGYRMRWVGHGVIGSLDPGQNASADACNFVTNPYGICPGPVTMKIPNYFESYFTAGYNFGHIGTMDSRVDVGVDNAFDKSPPFIWSNLALNANTDVATYDTIGRLFWARFTAKF